MKRVIYLTLIIGVLFSFQLSIDQVSCFYEIENGTFKYDVITSDFYIKNKREEFSTNKFNLNDQAISTDNQLVVTVTDVNDLRANYTMSSNGIEEDYLAAYIDFYIIAALYWYIDYNMDWMLYTCYDYEYYGDFNSTTIANGISLTHIMFFVLANETYWDIFRDISDSLNNYVNTYTDFYLTSSSTCEEIGDILIFESAVYFEHARVDYEGFSENGFICAYNTTNGVLLGFRSKGTFKGRSSICLHDIQMCCSCGEIAGIS